MKDYKDFYILNTKEEFILWLMGIIYVILISCVVNNEVFLKEHLVKIEKRDEKEYFAKLEKQKMEYNDNEVYNHIGAGFLIVFSYIVTIVR